MAKGWNLKFTFHFIKTTHEPFHLSHSCKFYLNCYFLWRSFWKWRGLTFWSYVGTNSKLLCAEFWIFLQYDTFIICYLLIVKYDTVGFSWYDDSIILKPQFHFVYLFINGVLNIRDTNTADEKALGYMYIYIYSVFVSWALSWTPRVGSQYDLLQQTSHVTNVIAKVVSGTRIEVMSMTVTKN
jgi:hypothetical protein